MRRLALALGLVTLLSLGPVSVSSDDIWSEKVSCCLKGCS